MSPVEPASVALADAIRAAREERDLTQEEVAFAAGITPGSYSRIECARSNATFTTVERIAAALGMSLVELAAAVEQEG